MKFRVNVSDEELLLASNVSTLLKNLLQQRIHREKTLQLNDQIMKENGI